MKNKILLIFFGILVFACLFATSAFAVDYSETVTLADGTVLPIYDENRNPLIWYVSGTDAEGNNIYNSVPNNRNEPSENNNTYVTYTINTDWMTQLQEVNFHVYNGSEYEVMNDDVYSVVVLNLRGLTSFQYINRGLRVNTIQYVYFNEILKDICDYFKGSTSLRLVDLSVCTDLTGGFGGAQNFSGCSNLHTVRLAIGPNYTFAGGNNYKFKNTAISSIVIPEAVISLGIDNFRDCKSLESIFFLGNETDLGQRNFEGCINLTNIYFLGDNPTIEMTSFIENFIECNDNGRIVNFRSTGKYFFFASTDMDYLSQVKDAIDGDDDNAVAVAIISYEDYVASPDSYKEGRYIISGTSVCDVYYGNHVLDESNSNSCATPCTVCGKAVMSSTPVHNYATAIEYSSFLANGVKTQACQNDGCVHNKTPLVTSTSPLFVCLGYSSFENGDGGITVGFNTNSTAMTEYTNTTGNSLTYGVFAVSQEKLGDNAIFGENGAASGVLSADVTIHGFDMFELKIVGFTDAQKSLKLAMGAYVAVTDGEKTTYSYLQDNQRGTFDGRYYFVSYNEIISK